MAQIIWTVLPNGVVGQNLKVTLFASLRFDTGTLGTDNWTQRVQNLSGLMLEFDNGTTTTPLPLQLDKSLLAPTLWNQVFPSNSKVTARAPKNYGARAIRSFPVKELRDQIETVYADTAERFGNRKPRFGAYENEDRKSPLFLFVSALGDVITDLENPPDDGPHVELASTLAQVQPVPLDTAPFSAAYHFYRRTTVSTSNDPPQIPIPDPDFHQAMGMLGDHPALLRRLGLIIDGVVAAGTVPQTGTTRVRLKAPQVGDLTPWTRYTYNVTNSSFLATPQSNSDLGPGFVRIGDTSRFEVQQLDIDGAALKLIDYSVNLFRVRNEEDSTGAEVPTLRTAGFIVAQRDRGTKMSTQLKRSFDTLEQSGGNVDLFAEDVTRGYRLDVQRVSDGVWRSLCQRKGSFLVGPSQQRVPQSGDITDEGYIKASGATSVADDPSTSKPLFAHEALFGWDGWSPVIRPPGRTTKFGGPGSPEVVDRIENTPATSFKVEPRFSVEPGTLPKLRFGEAYRLRARTVDLAGNSLPVSAQSTETTLATGSLTFKRYEPLPPPVLVLRRPVVEGESVEHVVIRTKVGSFDGPNNAFFSKNERHVAPPTATLDLILMHGAMDSVFHDATRSFNLALKSEGTFLDQEIWDDRGRRVRVPGIEIVNSPGVPPGTPPAFPAHRGDPLVAGQYVIHTNNKLLLPYLPDPLAVGVALANEETPTAAPVKILYGGSWPNPEPFKIFVEHTNAATASIVVDKGNFVVRLPPATILPLHFSSLLTQSALETKLSIWDLLSPEARSTLLTQAVNGQHWMITPFRKLVAVNAVQRPLRAAKFNSLEPKPERRIGETFVHLEAKVDNHAPSTGQIDIEASWVDPVDRLTDPGPTDDPHAGRIFSYQPAYTESVANIPRLSGFPEDAELPKHEFGDTKHRIVQYRPDTTTRYREYFPPAVVNNRANVLVSGEPFDLSVPSSARPEPPQVLYVVPTFRWESTTDGGGPGNGNGHPPTSATSKRVGRGLRVYLARPWFSSGVGELLGVVIPENDAPNAATKRYVSEWGSDPTWKGNGPQSHLSSSDFNNPADVSDTGLTLLEDPGITVQAVGFNVEYNAERQVWFSDIEFSETTGYFPFVRLALARFQPASIKDAHLSRVVKAEFVQLVNDRLASLQFGEETIRVTVSGFAAQSELGEAIATALPPPPDPAPAGPPGYEFDPAAGAGRVVVVHIEGKGPGNSDAEWQPVGSPVILPSFSPTGPMASPDIVWTGEVPRPPRTPASFDHRMIIQEIELFRTDAELGETQPVPTPTNVAVRGRVVYFDVLTL